MANMKNLLFGLALLVLSEVHSLDVFDESCLELIENKDLNRACCKQRQVWIDESPSHTVTPSPEYEKCKHMKGDTEESICAYITCVVQESGIMKYGEVDHDILQKNTTDPFLTELKRRCFGDKTHRFTLINNCPAVDLAACVYFNLAVTCDEWDVSDNCKKTVATMKKCKESLDRGSA